MPKQNDLPTPVTVNQKFLAKAAGMDVELPTAVTIDQMYLQAIAEGSGGGTTDAYTKAETDELLDDKADLVDGKVPAAQLPVDQTYDATSANAQSGVAVAQAVVAGKIKMIFSETFSYQWSSTETSVITPSFTQRITTKINKLYLAIIYANSNEVLGSIFTTSNSSSSLIASLKGTTSIQYYANPDIFSGTARFIVVSGVVALTMRMPAIPTQQPQQTGKLVIFEVGFES